MRQLINLSTKRPQIPLHLLIFTDRSNTKHHYSSYFGRPTFLIGGLRAFGRQNTNTCVIFSNFDKLPLYFAAEGGYLFWEAGPPAVFSYACACRISFLGQLYNQLGGLFPSTGAKQLPVYPWTDFACGHAPVDTPYLTKLRNKPECWRRAQEPKP